MLMDFETIILKKEDHIATIILNRPDRRNALSQQMILDLLTAINDIAADDCVRAVVMTGAGKGFCSGMDMDAISAGAAFGSEITVESMRHAPAFRVGHGLILGLQNLEKPTIAMVNGYCVGAGFDLALCCDMRMGADDTKFMCGFVKMGIYPPFGATWLYPRVMGLGKAFEYLFTGDTIYAQEALRIGVLNKVVPPDKLEEETMDLASRIAKGPPIPIRLMKSQIRRGLEMDLEMALDMAATYSALAMTTEDVKEGVAARFERRDPSFQGK